MNKEETRTEFNKKSADGALPLLCQQQQNEPETET